MIERLNELVASWRGVESDADCLSDFRAYEQEWLDAFVVAIIQKKLLALEADV